MTCIHIYSLTLDQYRKKTLHAVSILLSLCDSLNLSWSFMVSRASSFFLSFPHHAGFSQEPVLHSFSGKSLSDSSLQWFCSEFCKLSAILLHEQQYQRLVVSLFG